MRMKKTIWKKALSAVLSLAMAAGLLTSINRPLTVEAAASTLSITKFATKNELMNGKKFNLDGSGIAQLVYFGFKNDFHGIGNSSYIPQTWYIAGYDPVVGTIVFMCDPQNPICQSYFSGKSGLFTDEDIDGTYEGQTPTTVCTNHYGASELRAALRSIGSDLHYFTKSEQKLMEETTVYTYDKANSNVYSTRDKLYAAYGTSGNYIYVGSNAPATALLDLGLRINLSVGPFQSRQDNAYDIFWLRSPNTGSSNQAYGVFTAANYDSNTGVTDYYSGIRAYTGTPYGSYGGGSNAAVPAFAFNAEAVLFGSAAPVETEIETGVNGEFNAGMTMRLDDSIYNKIKSTVNYTYDENGEIDGVLLQKNRNEITDSYLCIQGKDETDDWFYSKKITGRQEFKFADMNHEVTVENCKIWIETTIDNLTYAKMAGSAATPTASISSGTYTADQSVTLSTFTKEATIYYTINGEEPTTESTIYTEPILVKGKPGESVEITIRAIAVRDDLGDSMEATFRYDIELPHAHNWSQDWTNNSKGHWHECTIPNCTVSENSGNYEYASHTEDEGTVTTQPTGKNTGVKTYRCSICGYVMRKETIPATGIEDEKKDDNSNNNNSNNSNDNNNSDNNNNGNNNNSNNNNSNNNSNNNNSNNNNSNHDNTNRNEPKPAAKNTVLTAAAQKCMVKVISASITNPTAAYVKPANSNAATISIPATVTVDGITYKVTSIAAGALANNKKVTKVTIGKNVTTIEKNAFKNCKKLKTVTVNSTVLKKIGANAFSGDKSLKTVTIKSTKLTSKNVGKNAFKGTGSKLTVKVPKKKVSAYKKFFSSKGNKKVTVK